jgi:hypothetical protein
MAARTKTGGRQRGAKNKRTLARERAQADSAAKIVEALGADAFDGDAHTLLMSVYKDPAQPIALRLDAAKAAIGYEKPRLAAADGKNDSGTTLEELVLGAYKRRAEMANDNRTRALMDAGPATR